MTKSRKQKQKKKDFLKKKLKVGKTNNKPANLTDTSFVARTINIRNQHLEDDHNDLTKRLSLLKHHNDTVRRETLQIFIKAIPKIIKTNIMTPILTQTIPLICDDSKLVRDSLIEMIDTIGQTDYQVLVLHCNIFILYINMSMTHIVPRIQADSTRFLLCLLKYCGDEIIRHAWLKLMNELLILLGWNKKMGANQSAGIIQTKKRDIKVLKVHLDALQKLIEEGCQDPRKGNSSNKSKEGSNVSYEPDNEFFIPEMPQPYSHLKLFARGLKNNNINGQISSMDGNDSSNRSGNSTNGDNMNQDLESRQEIFQAELKDTILTQSELLIKEGGECGKAANNLRQLITSLE